jgi:hypothetical protein
MVGQQDRGVPVARPVGRPSQSPQFNSQHRAFRLPAADRINLAQQVADCFSNLGRLAFEDDLAADGDAIETALAGAANAQIRACCFLTESGFPREQVSDSRSMLGAVSRLRSHGYRAAVAVKARVLSITFTQKSGTTLWRERHPAPSKINGLTHVSPRV